MLAVAPAPQQVVEMGRQQVARLAGGDHETGLVERRQIVDRPVARPVDRRKPDRGVRIRTTVSDSILQRFYLMAQIMCFFWE